MLSELICRPFPYHMRARNTIRIIYAWTLLAVFISVLALKDFHYHDAPQASSDKTETSHHAVIQPICDICEFTMHKATEAQFTEFVPVIKVTLLHRYLVSMQVVYRAVGSINSHSPPFLA